jgi:hypothetical protein
LARRLLNVLVLMSLLLCAASVVLWAWSYWSYARRDSYHRSVVHDEQAGAVTMRSSRECYVTIASGGVQFRSPFQESMTPLGQIGTRVRCGWEISGGRYPLEPPGAPGTKRSFTGGGFQLLVTDFRDVSPVLGPEHFGERSVTVPLWSVALATAILPAWWVQTRLRRTSHRRAGLCGRCGYDLRATPERCPECGRAAGPRNPKPETRMTNQ